MKFTIGIVGPCAAGKSTLVNNLRNKGYEVRHIAQEHSYVPDMWQRLSKPDYLIYLDVTYPISIQRRSLNWTQKDFNQQVYRLRHARENANLYINTDQLTIESVLEIALNFLADKTNDLISK